MGLVPKVFSRTSAREVQRELEPFLRDWERNYEEQEVNNLISTHDPARAVLGVDETLHQLQRGRVRELVIARGLKGNARQCVKCGWVDRTADPVCPLCGSERRSRTLRTVIPELASAFGVPMEIVAGKAADKLREHGGIGGSLGARKKPVQKIAVTAPASKARRVR
jgi:peptide subunit release factor 1 (eRF1)